MIHDVLSAGEMRVYLALLRCKAPAGAGTVKKALRSDSRMSPQAVRAFLMKCVIKGYVEEVPVPAGYSIPGRGRTPAHLYKGIIPKEIALSRSLRAWCEVHEVDPPSDRDLAGLLSRLGVR